MDSYLIITVIISLLSLYTTSKKSLHMYQQNSYDNKRFEEWMNDNPNVLSNFRLFYFAIAVLLNILAIIEIPVIAWVLLLLVYIDIYLRFIIESRAVYVKPLHITNRVKRQIITLTMLHLAAYGLSIMAGYYVNGLAACCLVLIYQFMIPYAVMLAGIINMPIEKHGRNSFIKDAKRIINSNPNLVKIGITGSFGKTSSKNVMQEILSEKFYSLMTPRSFNTVMGVTITIREQLKPTHEMFVCEMGSDKVGTIPELMDLVHPTISVITSIGPQHINTMGSLENIINEKFSVVEMLPPSGVAFLNIDNEYIRKYKVKNTCKIVTLGIESEDAMYRVSNIRYNPNGSDFDIILGGEWYPFSTRLLGTHNISNILCAVAVGYELGIDVKSLQTAVKRVNYVEHRLEVKKQGAITLIDNAFNSNPVGSKMSVEVLGQMPTQRILLTPGMIDLGEQEEEYNYKFGTYMKDNADIIILIGKVHTKPIYDGIVSTGFDMSNVYVVNTTKEAFELMHKLAEDGATVLIENDLPDAFNK